MLVYAPAALLFLLFCWRMLRDEEGMIARLLDGPDAGLEIRITGRDKAPLLCGEPGRGT